MVDSNILLDRAYSCNRVELSGLLELIEEGLTQGEDDSCLSRAKLVVTARLAP